MYFFIHHLGLLLQEANKIGIIIFYLITKKLKVKEFKVAQAHVIINCGTGIFLFKSRVYVFSHFIFFN